MTDWIIERCMQTGAIVRILADEEGTKEIHWKPDPKVSDLKVTIDGKVMIDHAKGITGEEE